MSPLRIRRLAGPGLTAAAIDAGISQHVSRDGKQAATTCYPGGGASPGTRAARGVLAS